MRYDVWHDRLRYPTEWGEVSLDIGQDAADDDRFVLDVEAETKAHVSAIEIVMTAKQVRTLIRRLQDVLEGDD